MSDRIERLNSALADRYRIERELTGPGSAILCGVSVTPLGVDLALSASGDPCSR